MELAPIKWTYSAWKTFKTCPRQYNHKYILRDIIFQQNEAAIFGDKVHKAIEDWFMQGTPMPTEFAKYTAMITPIFDWAGENICEMKLAVDNNLVACDYYGDYFVRGKADFVNLRLDKHRARVLDWKTSKTATYADIKQNELMALLLFAKYPELEEIYTALVFLVADKPVEATFKRSDMQALWRRWLYEAHMMQQAIAKNNFGPNPGGLCRKWCDVLSCEHNGKMGG